MPRLGWSLALAVGLVGVMETATTAQVSGRRVLERAAETVLRYPRYTIFDYVEAEYERGTLTLTGKVTMPFKRTDVERLVQRIEGVEEVDNRIEVLPVSIFDDRLRQDIARAIYGNPSFWHYASMPNPPIHILVENGRVTLIGVVQSEVERQLARSLATSFGAFSVANELLTEQERRRSDRLR